MPRLEDVRVGDEVEERVVVVDQALILRYAGASGDFNPLHWDPDTAAGISPTGEVIAHGMLSMGLAAAAVTRWAGGAGNVLSVTASFRAPCPLGAALRVGGSVLQVEEIARTATLSMWAELDGGERVVDRRRSRAVVRLQ